MYQINDLDEHDAVFTAIQANGLADVPLWLGLKQFPALNPNEKFDEGWYPQLFLAPSSRREAVWWEAK